SALSISTEYVAIHDGARPLVETADIDRVLDVAIRDRAAILAAPIVDTVKRTADGYVLATLDRAGLYGAQTPQVFQYDLIMEAHKSLANGEFDSVPTDDAQLIEERGFKVRIVEPTGMNLKVTTSDDLNIVKAILKRQEND
ncbi:MAG: 2-C-methyl-D-erythritol 4-phosphate cytidylyltransferase, partial [candidate division Zixibacteria bacterium]|nr:2-C-methyl-D-erythritol 4-phosphate cytidylyltransferase [candidate division Zixibacteria bacterium]